MQNFKQELVNYLSNPEGFMVLIGIIATILVSLSVANQYKKKQTTQRIKSGSHSSNTQVGEINIKNGK